MSREKPVGSAEGTVLGWLSSHGGRWTSKDGSVWESMHWTRQLLASLAGKGLVQEVSAGAHYTLTSEGDRLLAQLGFSAVVPSQRPRPYTGNASGYGVELPAPPRWFY